MGDSAIYPKGDPKKAKGDPWEKKSAISRNLKKRQ